MAIAKAKQSKRKANTLVVTCDGEVRQGLGERLSPRGRAANETDDAHCSFFCVSSSISTDRRRYRLQTVWCVERSIDRHGGRDTLSVQNQRTHSPRSSSVSGGP
ncbi:hypothetical protein NHX12_029988 [Muraenolepis orangiensis]|uniref:Uncharacterized protein n=1 Tax=Muraenolepis orangiensis TaxID=630683 RepID=A0A9Q0IKL3_9TELE|nr:hypothetical protein NHX12_029988 [Muraenolepis orangiensis]